MAAFPAILMKAVAELRAQKAKAAAEEAAKAAALRCDHCESVLESSSSGSFTHPGGVECDALWAWKNGPVSRDTVEGLNRMRRKRGREGEEEGSSGGKSKPGESAVAAAAASLAAQYDAKEVGKTADRIRKARLPELVASGAAAPVPSLATLLPSSASLHAQQLTARNNIGTTLTDGLVASARALLASDVERVIDLQSLHETRGLGGKVASAFRGVWRLLQQVPHAVTVELTSRLGTNPELIRAAASRVERDDLLAIRFEPGSPFHAALYRAGVTTGVAHFGPYNVFIDATSALGAAVQPSAVLAMLEGICADAAARGTAAAGGAAQSDDDAAAAGGTPYSSLSAATLGFDGRGTNLVASRLKDVASTLATGGFPVTVGRAAQVLLALFLNTGILLLTPRKKTELDALKAAPAGSPSAALHQGLVAALGPGGSIGQALAISSVAGALAPAEAEVVRSVMGRLAPRAAGGRASDSDSDSGSGDSSDDETGAPAPLAAATLAPGEVGPNNAQNRRKREKRKERARKAAEKAGKAAEKAAKKSKKDKQ